MAAGFSPATMALTLPTVAYASLPLASDYPSSVVSCPDAPGGASLLFSDGSYWRPFARGQQSKRVTTGAGGVVTWTFATPFPAGVTPVCNYMVENTGAQPMSVEITAISNAAVTIKLKQARSLPATLTLLTALVNFDIFGGTGVSGITVHLTVRMPTE